MLIYDAVIIGSGIAGMTSAIYLKRAGLNILVIEAEVPGGQLNKSYKIENYPGYNSISGPDLAINIYESVKELDVEYLYNEVISIDFDNKIINLENKQVNYKYLIIATGRSPRKLAIDTKEMLGISYCALCEGSFYKNKEVAVIGGGNSALEDALYLSTICKKVKIIHRKNKFTGERSLIEAVNNTSNIEILFNTEVKDILGETSVSKLVLSTGDVIEVAGIFVCIGYVPNSEIFFVEKENNYIVVNNNMETSISDVYACGDIIKKDTYQLTTACGEATVAAYSIIKKFNK